MVNVSVIIPAYNSAQHLRSSIDSALAQRDVSVEVIVVDDGSTDETWQVISSYGTAIRGIQQANGGAYVARNNAASVATGEWLAFLDADDTWADDKLAKQLALSSPEVGLIYADCGNEDESGRVTARTSQVHTLAEGDIFESLLAINFIATSTVLMRRSRFAELGGFSTDIRGCADWDMWLRHALRGGRVRVHPDALATYRWHPAQMSKSFAARQRDRLEVIRRAVEGAQRAGRVVPGSLQREAYASSWATAAWFVEPSDRWQSVKWRARALALQPTKLSHYKALVKSIIGANR